MIGLLIAATQVSVILLVALVLVWLLGRRTASQRHAVMVIAMACAAVVPILGALLPSWASRTIVMPSVVAAPFAPGVSSALVRVQSRSPDVALAQPLVPDGASELFVADVQTYGPDSAESVVGSAPPPQSGNWRASLPRVLDAVFMVYLAGLVFSLAVLATGLLRLRWIAARSEPMDSEPWQRQAAVIAGAFRLRRPVHFARSQYSSLLAVWRMVQPQVLLPAGAEHWPEDRIRAVLLHELAHVRRNDWSVQLLASVFCAVYWFNPLVWIACARLQHESEQACDDAVLEQGMDATEYAAHLLAMARTFVRPTRMLASAPAMARRSTLQRRVAKILDPSILRSATTRTAVVRPGAALLLVTCVVAACDGVRTSTGEAGVSPGPSALTIVNDAEPDVPVPVPSPIPTADTDSIPAVDVEPGMAVPMPEGRILDERHSPQMVVASILDLVRSALEDESTASLDDLTYPVTGLRHLQRSAQSAVADNGHNPVEQAARYTEIVNALNITANLATNITSRPRGPQLSRPEFDQLAAALRAKAEELSAVLMPVTAVTSRIASTPEHRAAFSALDLAQSARRDALLVGRNPNNWLATELITLERAAQSVVNDDGAMPTALISKLNVLMGSIRSTARQASQIAGRTDGAADARRKAADLAGSLQEVSIRLETAMSRLPPSVRPDDPMASVLASVPGQVPGLRLATLRRSDGVLVAAFGGQGPTPLNVLIEEAATDVEAMRKEDWSVVSTPGTGFVQQRNGMRVHAWGEEGDGNGYRVLTRTGTTVVNVSAPPELSGFVLPVLDSIVQQLRAQAR